MLYEVITNCGGLKSVPKGLSEMAVTRLMHQRAAQDGFYSSFIGAGAYEHHIPAAVWQIVTRGDRITSYNVCYTKLLRRRSKTMERCKCC